MLPALRQLWKIIQIKRRLGCCSVEFYSCNRIDATSLLPRARRQVCGPGGSRRATRLRRPTGDTSRQPTSQGVPRRHALSRATTTPAHDHAMSPLHAHAHSTHFRTSQSGPAIVEVGLETIHKHQVNQSMLPYPPAIDRLTPRVYRECLGNHYSTTTIAPDAHHRVAHPRDTASPRRPSTRHRITTSPIHAARHHHVAHPRSTASPRRWLSR